MHNLNVLIVSGCMAEQDIKKENIEHSSLYHQVLKNRLEKKYNKTISPKIVRYERFSPCISRIKKKFNKDDLIIFQVRGNHYLKTIKFFRFYRDRLTGNKKPGFNILKLRESVFEHHMPYMENKPKGKSRRNVKKPRSLTAQIKSNLRTAYQSLNYSIGIIIGNEKIAFDNYKNLIEQVIQFAKSNHVPIMFIGVASRLNNRIANKISEKLNKKIGDYLRAQNFIYIDIFGDTTDENIYKFSTDYIVSLNKHGHQEIAEKLLLHVAELNVEEPLLDK